jgi:hypothetical protein
MYVIQVKQVLPLVALCATLAKMQKVRFPVVSGSRPSPERFG